MRRRSVIFAAAVLSMLLPVGCSVQAEAVPQGEPSLPAALPQIDMTTFQLPLDAYLPDPRQARTLTEARNILALRCLARFGFAIKAPELPEPSSIGNNQLRYLIADEERAQTYGYKVPEITQAPRPAEPELSLEARSVMSGEGASVVGGLSVPEGGCLGEASKGLGADQGAESGRELVHRLTNESYSRTQKDSRVVAAVARWSECMSRAGYNYPDPGRANDDPVFATATASKGEIATAVADVRCKRESSLIDLMAAVESAYQRRSIDQHAEQLRAARERLEKQLRAAADVVAGRS